MNYTPTKEDLDALATFPVAWYDMAMDSLFTRYAGACDGPAWCRRSAVGYPMDATYYVHGPLAATYQLLRAAGYKMYDTAAQALAAARQMATDAAPNPAAPFADKFSAVFDTVFPPEKPEPATAPTPIGLGQHGTKAGPYIAPVDPEQTAVYVNEQWQALNADLTAEYGPLTGGPGTPVPMPVPADNPDRLQYPKNLEALHTFAADAAMALMAGSPPVPTPEPIAGRELEPEDYARVTAEMASLTGRSTSLLPKRKPDPPHPSSRAGYLEAECVCWAGHGGSLLTDIPGVLGANKLPKQGQKAHTATYRLGKSLTPEMQRYIAQALGLRWYESRRAAIQSVGARMAHEAAKAAKEVEPLPPPPVPPVPQRVCWSGPGGALVTDYALLKGLSGPQLQADARRFYGGDYLLAETMATPTQKALAHALGLEWFPSREAAHGRDT